MHRAIDENHSHYLQTTGIPRLLELLAEKLRTVNGIPVGAPDEVMVTTGGIHALYIVCQALLEPGDEVIVPDPEWPPCMGNIKAARAVPGALPPARAPRAGGTTSPSSSRRSRRGRARSTSTRRTTRPAACSRAQDVEAIAAHRAASGTCG